MILLDNQEEISIDILNLNLISKNYTQKDVELVIINNATMKEINKNQRGIEISTDVLSFPYKEVEYLPIGSIVINSKFVQDKAHELGHSVEEELTLLFIHGLLHILGFDHESDNGQMRDEEEKIIKQFNLPKSLIVRTGEI